MADILGWVVDWFWVGFVENIRKERGGVAGFFAAISPLIFLVGLILGGFLLFR
ncbi:hypothetical protein [Sphingosinicella humi]|uniref:hypothetical protein n=1 Tax=Allosphingosinicella humi TaxID=2068657 RepID=UPI0013048BF0|nr:hypothetical protein [Sphingosinicella humi]